MEEAENITLSQDVKSDTVQVRDLSSNYDTLQDMPSNYDTNSPNHLPLTTNHSPLTTNHQESPSSPKGGSDPCFDVFWAAYPKKRAKADAQKAWKKLKPDDALFSVIIDALKKQKAWNDWQREAGRFIPYPATWLNGNLWTDEESQALPFCEPPQEGYTFGKVDMGYD